MLKSLRSHDWDSLQRSFLQDNALSICERPTAAYTVAAEVHKYNGCPSMDRGRMRQPRGDVESTPWVDGELV
jgi:hypothetical protein